MAATELTVQAVARTGLEATYTAANADGGHVVDNQADRRMFLHVKNGDSGAHTVTVATPGTVDDLAISDLEVTIPAGEERFIGPFPSSVYNSSGQVTVTFDGVTSVTIAALRLPNA
jgi:hypothetical protein